MEHGARNLSAPPALEFCDSVCYNIFVMKFAFWKKRKKEEPEAEPEPPQPALSVFVSGSPAADESYEGCETVSADITAGEPRGRYVLFADDGQRHPDGLGELLGLLAERSEELLLFRTEAKDETPAAESLIRQGLAPRKVGCVVSLELFRRLPAPLRCACRGERLAALLLLAESSASLGFIGEDQGTAPADAEKAAESLRAFIRFFGGIKASLDSEKYRFAFAYACGRVIGTYAEFAAENKAEELRLFDDFLKEENMALRVAAKERSSLVRRLVGHNFRAPLWLLPLCAAAAAKDRARR